MSFVEVFTAGIAVFAAAVFASAMLLGWCYANDRGYDPHDDIH